MDKPTVAPDLQGDFTALSIVDFCVVPHCTNFPFKKATEKILITYSDTLDLRPISNNQAIVVNGDKVETVTAKSEGTRSISVAADSGGSWSTKASFPPNFFQQNNLVEQWNIIQPPDLVTR
jgi:hypothetical protein